MSHSLGGGGQGEAQGGKGKDGKGGQGGALFKPGPVRGSPGPPPGGPGRVLNENIEFSYKKRKANVPKKLKLPRKRKRTPPEKLEVRKAKSERRPKVS